MHTVWGSRGRGSPTVLWCGQCWTLQSLAWAGPSMRAGDQVSPAHTPTARDRLPPHAPCPGGWPPHSPSENAALLLQKHCQTQICLLYKCLYLNVGSKLKLLRVLYRTSEIHSQMQLYG